MTLKTFTLRYLRELAKKHLGRAHIGLKTRDELLQALRKFIPGLPGGEPETPKAEVIQLHKELQVAPPPPARTPVAAPAPAPVPAEPLVEGFFVARVQGEDEARRHHLTWDGTSASPPAPLEQGIAPEWLEHLPEIPWSFGDDRVVLLCRDPHAAHTYWDVRAATRDAAFRGLPHPRVVLRVFEGGHEARSVDIALEARSWYLTGLSPGRTFHVELHAVGSDGQSRRIGPASNAVTLPPDDISSDTTVRFMRVDWNTPLNRMKGRIPTSNREEEIEPLEIVHRRWVPLPASGSWQLMVSKEKVPRSHWGDDFSRVYSPGGSSFAGPVREGSGS